MVTFDLSVPFRAGGIPKPKNDGPIEAEAEPNPSAEAADFALINNFMVIFMGIKWWFSWIENDDFHGDFTKKWDIIMGM